VLNAYILFTQPADVDLASLQALFPEEERFLPPDELARAVIDREIRAAHAESHPA
jgi:hypothetical protein